MFYFVIERQRVVTLYFSNKQLFMCLYYVTVGTIVLLYHDTGWEGGGGTGGAGAALLMQQYGLNAAGEGASFTSIFSVLVPHLSVVE